jgi:hypothetical protein
MDAHCVLLLLLLLLLLLYLQALSSGGPLVQARVGV